MAVGFLSHRSRFDSSRPCRLPPAQDGMKLGTLVGGRVRVSLAPAAPPLDSRFRGNDEVGGGNDEAGMTRWGAGLTTWGAGMTMALRGPHKRMKMVGRRVFAYCMAVLPHPSPSGFRPSPE